MKALFLLLNAAPSKLKLKLYKVMKKSIWVVFLSRIALVMVNKQLLSCMLLALLTISCHHSKTEAFAEMASQPFLNLEAPETYRLLREQAKRFLESAKAEAFATQDVRAYKHKVKNEFASIYNPNSVALDYFDSSLMGGNTPQLMPLWEKVLNEHKIQNEFEKQVWSELIEAANTKNIRKMAVLIRRVQDAQSLYSSQCDNQTRERLIPLLATVEAAIEVYFGSLDNVIRMSSIEARDCWGNVHNSAIVGGITGGLTGLYNGCRTGMFFGFNPGSAAAGCLGGLIGGTIVGMIIGGIEGAIECGIFSGTP